MKLTGAASRSCRTTAALYVLVPSCLSQLSCRINFFLSFSSGRGEKSGNSLHPFLGTSCVPGSLLNAPGIALCVRKALCLHPKGRAAWSGVIGGIPITPSCDSRCPGGERSCPECCTPFLSMAAVFHLSVLLLPRQHVILCGMLRLL